jgi:hypothetical protein
MQPDAKRTEKRIDKRIDAFDRRQLLVFGGTGVTMAALLAACGQPEKPDPIPEVGELSEVTPLPTVTVTDAVLLRTAASLVRSAIGVYDAMLDLGVLRADGADVATMFRDHHAAHARMLDEATTEAGGQPYTDPNPRFEADVVDPAIQLIADNGNQVDDVLRFLDAIETVALTTNQSFVPMLTLPAYRQTLMEIGAIEARQSTVIASFIENSYVLGEDVVVGDTGDVAEEGAGGTDGAETTLAVSAAVKLPVSQVPTTFSTLSPVQVSIGDQILTINTPAANSYAY